MMSNLLVVTIIDIISLERTNGNFVGSGSVKNIVVWYPRSNLDGDRMAMSIADYNHLTVNETINNI